MGKVVNGLDCVVSQVSHVSLQTPNFACTGLTPLTFLYLSRKIDLSQKMR